MATLVRWEPLRELTSLQNDMARWMSGFFDGPGRVSQSWVPPLDVWETDVDVVYSFDLPGILQEQREEVASMTELLHVIERGKENLLLVEEYLSRASGGESPIEQGPPPAAGGALWRAVVLR